MTITIADLLARAEARHRAAERDAADARNALKRFIDLQDAAGVESITDPAALQRVDALAAANRQARDELTAASGALAEIRAASVDEAVMTARQAEQHPTGYASPGGGRGGPAGTGMRASGARDSGPRWTREDGRPAAVERGQRFADNEIVAELAARDPGRAITETYSGLGSLVRSMSTTSASALVPTIWSANIIDKARNASRVIEAGAETIPMDAKQLNIGRLTADATAAWIAEAGTRVPADETFDTVSLVAKTMYAFTTLSLEFAQDAPNADSLIEESISKAMALELDLSALFGGASGTDFTAATGAQASPPGPLGILGNLQANYTAGILGAGANGTAITAATPWNELLTTYYLPLRNNEAPTAILMNAAMAQKYSMTYDTLGQPLRKPDALANVPWLITNQIPSFTQGTMTSIATDIFCGDFRQVLIGTRLDMTLQVLTERYAEVGLVGLLATFRGDIALARPRSMAVYRYIGGS